MAQIILIKYQKNYKIQCIALYLYINANSMNEVNI